MNSQLRLSGLSSSRRSPDFFINPQQWRRCMYKLNLIAEKLVTGLTRVSYGGGSSSNDKQHS